MIKSVIFSCITVNGNLGKGSITIPIGGFGYSGNHDWNRYTYTANASSKCNFSAGKFKNYNIGVQISMDAGKWMYVKITVTTTNNTVTVLDKTYSGSAISQWFYYSGTTDYDITNVTYYMEETYGRAWIGDANVTLSN